jgi:phospholipase C
MGYKDRGLLAIALMAAVVLSACGDGIGSNRASGSSQGDGGSPPPLADIMAVNHVIVLLQENRSFDHYFGTLNQYRAANGYPNNVDGLPPGGATNPGPLGPVTSYHTGSICTENTSPDWKESHKEMNNSGAQNYHTPTMDGFVSVAAGAAQFQGFVDVGGRRAMSYFNETDLPYYYFMASNFAMSDRWFSPVPTETPPNRAFMLAATSGGCVHMTVTSGCGGINSDTSKTIFQLLSQHNISWKIYITDVGQSQTDLRHSTYLQFFQPFGGSDEIVSHLARTDCTNNPTSTLGCGGGLNDFMTDVKNNTLPAVAFIETGQESGRDEHPSGHDPATGITHVESVQKGALFISGLMNALMNSASWSSSVFFIAFDEGGGFYDHVPPFAEPSPDGIKPRDLYPTDLTTIPDADFNLSGFRVPNMVVSPFAKKSYVSHTNMDHTAILHFIETRWNLPSLNARDAAQPDMTEFFDFANVPWSTPPTPPVQPTNGVCDFTKE